MPITGTQASLSSALRTAMLADPDIGAVDDVGLTAMCDAIANTVIAHLVANGALAVVPTLLVAPPGGGPVTGTADLV